MKLTRSKLQQIIKEELESFGDNEPKEETSDEIKQRHVEMLDRAIRYIENSSRPSWLEESHSILNQPLRYDIRDFRDEFVKGVNASHADPYERLIAAALKKLYGETKYET